MRHRFRWGVGFLVLGLAGGCTASAPTASAPKPGKGIAEYRQVAGQAHLAVAGTVKTLEGLTLSAGQSSVPPAALARFDKSLAQLELDSVKARSRAEAIIARGQAYFDEWKENLSSITNQSTAKAETERYDRLLEHFGRVRQRSGEVREVFRPFMAKLRGFRATLDRNPEAISNPASQGQVTTLAADGRRVLQSLEAVLTALEQAETEVRNMRSTR